MTRFVDIGPGSPLAGIKNLYVCEVTASTNDDAKALAAGGAPHGTVVLARAQTDGRGRLGRAFLSLPGGVYLSMIVRGGIAHDPVRLTVSTAVAAARVIEDYAYRPVGIKWVNDLWLGEKKCAGILAEGVPTDPTRPDATPHTFAAVVGIGVNLANPLPSELEGRATSVWRETGVLVDFEHFAADLCRSMRSFLRDEAPLPFDEYDRRQVLTGRRVTVLSPVGSAYPATVIGLERDCALSVRDDEGIVRRLTAGEVSLGV